MLGPRAGIHLQEDVEARSDVLVYTSEVLQHDMEVTGPITAVLFVRTSAPSTDFTVKLVDVYPGGRAYNVCDGIFRRNYENGENSPHRPTQSVSIYALPAPCPAEATAFASKSAAAIFPVMIAIRTRVVP